MDRRVPAMPFAVPCEPARRDRKAARTPPGDALKNTFGVLRRDREDHDALPARALKALRTRGLEPVDPASARLLRADGDARAWVVPVPDVSATPFACVRGSAPGRPREGIAVVSLGGAPAGGGGALRDLRRGLAPVALDPCAGTGRDMLGVSGIVPDGVEAVFVTAADGTSTRADVHDNGYVFVLPRSRRPEQRYLVWTGADGAPHVQPVPLVLPGGRRACGRLPVVARVTPDGLRGGCGPFGGPSALFAPHPMLTPPTRPSRGRRGPRPRLIVPMPAPIDACIALDPWTSRILSPPGTILALPPSADFSPGPPMAVPSRPPGTLPAIPRHGAPAPAPPQPQLQPAVPATPAQPAPVPRGP